jgi:hypothetical protein
MSGTGTVNKRRVFEVRAMRLPRMTTRRWVAAIMVSGLLMGWGVRLWRRESYFVARARHHADMAQAYGFWGPIVMGFLKMTEGSQERADLEHMRAILPSHIAYHEALARKYRRAARHPWLPVEPDPPPPPE